MCYSIGLGITNKCNYNCSHCYSREGNLYELPVEKVKQLCESLDITAVNLGTGESGLHRNFLQITEYIYNRGIKAALTTNGYTIALLDDEHLKMFSDIDFSVDFASEDSHDSFRGIGASQMVERGIERCKKLGIECSFACAMMKDNYSIMDKMVEKARQYNVNLRINVYKPVHTNKHLLTYDEFWEGVKRLFGSSKIVSCSEPIINSLIKNKTLDGGSRCGNKSLRIRPDGGIVPCVYWNRSVSSVDELVSNKRNMSAADFEKYINSVTSDTKVIPEECLDCDILDICKGGCAARRLYNDLYKPDPYCFKLYGRKAPKIDFEWGESKDLVHSSYLCTIIVQYDLHATD